MATKRVSRPFLGDHGQTLPAGLCHRTVPRADHVQLGMGTAHIIVGAEETWISALLSRTALIGEPQAPLLILQET